MDQHWSRKYLWQSSLEAFERSTVLFNPPFGTRHDPSFPFFKREIIEQVGKRFMDGERESASAACVPSRMEAAVEPAGQVNGG
jgi:hypothetical protein